MDYLPISKRRKSIILIIAILIHALIFLLLFAALWSEKESGLDPLSNLRHLFQQAHVLPQSPLASEQASVIFQDEPEASHDGAQEEAQTPTKPELQQEIHQDEIRQPEETPTTVTQEPLPELQEVVHEAASAPAPTIVETPKPPVQHKQQSSAKVGSAHGVTIGDITRGFIKSLRQESGRSGEHADAQTLARQRYSTRVWSLLKDSYRAHRKPTYLLSDLTTEATLLLTIAKDGSLRSVELEHPNKTHDLYEIEQILKHAVKKAGLYPPLPAVFDADVITLRYPMMISIHEGIHTYDFMYQ